MLTFGRGESAEKFSEEFQGYLQDDRWHSSWFLRLREKARASKNNMKLLLECPVILFSLGWALLNAGQMGQTDKNQTADVGRYPGSCLISNHMDYQNKPYIPGFWQEWKYFGIAL